MTGSIMEDDVGRWCHAGREELWFRGGISSRKTKKIMFKNGTQQLALATFHHILLHST